MTPDEIDRLFQSGAHSDLPMPAVRELDLALIAARNAARRILDDARGRYRVALLQRDEKAADTATADIAVHSREVERATVRRAELDHLFDREGHTTPGYEPHGRHYREPA